MEMVVLILIVGVMVGMIITGYWLISQPTNSQKQTLKSKPKSDNRGMSVPLRILIGVGSWFGIAVIFNLFLGELRGTDMAFFFHSLNILNFIFWVWFIFTGKLLIISNFRSSSSEKEVKVLNEELKELKAREEIKKLKEEIDELKKKSDNE